MTLMLLPLLAILQIAQLRDEMAVNGKEYDLYSIAIDCRHQPHCFIDLILRPEVKNHGFMLYVNT